MALDSRARWLPLVIGDLFGIDVQFALVSQVGVVRLGNLVAVLLVRRLNEPKVVEDLPIRIFAPENVEAFVEESLLLNINIIVQLKLLSRLRKDLERQLFGLDPHQPLGLHRVVVFDVHHFVPVFVIDGLHGVHLSRADSVAVLIILALNPLF